MTDEITILETLSRLLTQSYPDYPVYTDFCPPDFHRPCFLLDTNLLTRKPLNRTTIQETLHLTLTWIDTDSSPARNLPRLQTMQRELRNLFRTGALQADDRTIRVQTESEARGPHEVYIDLRLDYTTEFPPDNHQPSPSPLMQEVRTKLE